jgi:hypothetical protein
MRMRRNIALVLGMAALGATSAAAQEAKYSYCPPDGPPAGQWCVQQPVSSVLAYPLNQIKRNTIVFYDQRTNDDSNNAFVRFDDWSRLKPVQKQYLSLFPNYVEPMIHKVVEGVKSETASREELQLYVVEARFKLSRPAAAIDLKRYATVQFIESLDPSIKHQVIKAADMKVFEDERYAANRNPERNWCEGPTVALCVHSVYKLEGKLPMGIALANKIRESERKLSDKIEFESELRLVTPTEDDSAGLKRLTGLNAPVTGVVEQTSFYINQVIRFGKLVIVLQPNPDDASSTVATVLIALAVSSNTLESKKKYQDVPVLKNLVPAQVLLGKSNFNTGGSISAGLPTYVRNQLKAMARILDQG